jgi:hypothetical protein
MNDITDNKPVPCDNANLMDQDKSKIQKKEVYYYRMIDNFFRDCDKAHISNMIQIIQGESDISLRILDWFVTRYSAQYKITFETNSDKQFNVHISYKAQLKSFKKRYFDPFRRRRKINYNYDKDDTNKRILTTIGQLNFFRWAISNHVIKYVQENYQEIIRAMNKSNKDDKIRKKLIKIKKQESNSNKKNVSIPQHNLNQIVETNNSFILSFD